MASLVLPPEFKTYHANKNYRWFILDGNIRSDTVFSIETNSLENVTDSTHILVGIRKSDYLYTYEPILKIDYVPQSVGDGYFNIIVGTDMYQKKLKLLPILNTTNNMSNQVNQASVNKMAHLFKGLRGESAYELWAKTYHNVPEDEFTRGLNTAYKLGNELNNTNRAFEGVLTEFENVKTKIRDNAKDVVKFRAEMIETKYNAIEEMQEEQVELTKKMNDELSLIAAQEIIELKAMIMKIKQKQDSLGHNFRTVVYKSSTTFTVDQNAIYHYVFVQGGTGSSGSSSAGGASSFGSYITASGGSGDPNGVGHKGEVVSGFLTLTPGESISISISSGGMCSVSWSIQG